MFRVETFIDNLWFEFEEKETAIGFMESFNNLFNHYSSAAAGPLAEHIQSRNTFAKMETEEIPY